MRQVLSLSLPQKVTEEIKALSKKRGFSSVSSYIKHLIELDQDLISDTELLKSVREAEEEYRNGETVTAESIEDLL